MHEDHPGRRQALGAGGAHIVFAQHLEHRRAGHAGNHRQRDGAQHDGRQDQVAHGIEERALFVGKQGVDQHEAGLRLDVVEQVETAGHRRPAQRHGEQHDQDQAPPEDRHRIAGEGHRHHPVVEQRTAFQGGDHPGQQAEGAGEEHGGQGQFQGRREQGEEFVPDAFAGGQRFAEIALCQVAHVVQVLLVQRLVQAQAVQGLGMHLRIDATFAHHHFHRVAGNQADQREGEQRHAEEGGDQQPQSSCNETKHVGG
ncbi:Uncharacterised protein [Klebsiella pneumoniae]|nr:Uncharacterised protein [Klebsiella pneumoniae]